MTQKATTFLRTSHNLPIALSTRSINKVRNKVKCGHKTTLRSSKATTHRKTAITQRNLSKPNPSYNPHSCTFSTHKPSTTYSTSNPNATTNQRPHPNFTIPSLHSTKPLQRTNSHCTICPSSTTSCLWPLF